MSHLQRFNRYVVALTHRFAVGYRYVAPLALAMVGAWRLAEVRDSRTATEVAVGYANAVEQIDKEYHQKKAEEVKKPEEASVTEQATAVVTVGPSKQTGGMTMPRRALHAKLALVPSSELLQTLKTNDLATVGARSASIIEAVEAEDYAMAA